MPVDQPEDLSNDLLEEQPESVDKYAEDIFGNESIDYDTILQAAADSISEKTFECARCRPRLLPAGISRYRL